MFHTLTGTELKHSNIRKCVLDKAITRANASLIRAEDVPLPDGITPHKLRHTYASILVALGVDPGNVMDQLGHTDPASPYASTATACAATQAPPKACSSSSE